jgi:hypothetical protein
MGGNTIKRPQTRAGQTRSYLLGTVCPVCRARLMSTVDSELDAFHA